MLHVELADIGITEILFIPFEIFLSHLIGIYEMNLSVFHMDVILKPGEQIRIVFVFYGHGVEFRETSDETIRRLIVHFEYGLQLLLEFRPLLFVFGKAGQNRYHQL